MSWNYRICKTTTTGAMNDKAWTNTCYAIHEVYYNKDGEIWALTEDAIAPLSDTAPGTDNETEEECISSVRDQLEKMLLALDKPVVDIDNIVYADSDTGAYYDE